MSHFVILRNAYTAWSISLQFCTANRGMLCYAYWKSQDWRPDSIPWNRLDSCNSRGKSRNRKGIFTVCPIAVYPTAASLGNSSRRRRPRRPGRHRRRLNTAGKRVIISKVFKEREYTFENQQQVTLSARPSIRATELAL